MKLSELKREIDFLIDENTADFEVVIPNSVPSIGRVATIDVRSLSLGFDWDSGLAFLSPSESVVVKPKRGSIEAFFEKIQAECNKQDKKWGIRNQHPLVWMSILTEEVGEVSKEINDAGFDSSKLTPNYQTELVQCAAVICQMLKNIKLYKK